MREHWDKAINEIDEKYISEAAQTHAKHVRKKQELEQYEQEASHPTELKPAAQPKKSRKGMIIGLSAAAAAVVAVGVGGGIMLSRGNNDVLLPTETPTVEATVEADEFTTDEDGIIIFSQSYEEGNITFEKPEIYHTTGGDITIASPIEQSENGVLAYIEDFSTIKAEIPHENLLNNGYTYDEERSHYNSMAGNAMGEDIGHQVSLVYTKGDAEIVVNYGETGQNYRILRLPGDFGGKLTAGEKLSGMLRNYDNNGSSEVYCGGMVVDGVPYYAVTTYWYNEETDIRGTCVISAMGCDIVDITDILAGVICRSDMLHPVSGEPFDASDYQYIECCYNDNEMQLTDDMTASLSELLSKASTEPMYDGDDLDIGHDAYLNMYVEYPYGETSILRLHEGGGKYYYSLGEDYYKNRAYFEVPSEVYSELREWFSQYAPLNFIGTVLAQDDIGNTTDPAAGRYYVRDNNGEEYIIHSDELFEIGDTVRVHYYGAVMESYPAQVNSYAVEKAYNMPLDDTPLIPEGAAEMGFDTEIFSSFFSQSWEGGYTLSYQSPSVANSPVCFEMEDGYFLGYYNNVAAEVCFIPKSHTDTLFHYYVDDYADTSTGQLRNEGYTELIPDYVKGAPDNSFPMNVNGFGEEKLFETMGYNFRDIYWDITDSYTDENWTVWEHHVSNLFERPPYVDYSVENGSAVVTVLYSSADSIDEYWKKTDESVLVNRYYMHTIKFNDDEQKYEITESFDNETGEPDNGPAVEDEHIPDPDAVTVRSLFGDYDYYINLDYIPVETETGIKVTEPELYVTVNETSKNISFEDFEILNLGLLPNSEMPKRSRVFLREVELESGAAFALMVPIENADGERLYHTTFYLFRDNELHKFGLVEHGADFYPVLSDTQIYYPEATDVVTMVGEDGAAHSYHFNCDTLEASPSDIVARAGYNYIYFDKALDSMSCAVSRFFGKWGNEHEVLTIGFYESPFTYADPLVGCYEDEKGYFMLGESRAWYVPKDDTDMLYYFDNVTDGQRIDTESCTAVYQNLHHAVNNGIYGGNGEMGYLRLLDLCSTLYSTKEGEMLFNVSDFFDMEITDENGTRWVRTADRNVDWGGVYEIYINGESAYCLKMQNADDPSEFRYFSFFLSVSDDASIWEEQGAFRTESEKAVLTWTDVHYCFDLSVCDTKELPTEFAEESETEATQHGHGYFVVEPHFYPCADGSYYAQRIMGNNQGQWYSDAELFYNDGSGYQLISDEIGYTQTYSIGDRLYVVHNTQTGIALSIYSGTELIDAIDIATDGQKVQMGTWAEVYGNYLVIEYYDSTKLKNVYAVVNGTTLSVVYYDSLRFNDDGTVDFPEG